MNRIVYIYRAFLAMLICVASVFCLCGCDVVDIIEDSDTASEIVQVPKPTHSPTPEPVYTPDPTPTLAPTPDPTATVTTSGAIVGGDTSGEQKYVALTFDDGPYGETTNRILDVVEQYSDYGVHVTFFTLGSQVAKFPDTVRRAYNLGCEIANHTYDHKNLTKITESERKSQVEDAADLIKSVTGEKPRLVRPPYGAKNDDVRASVKYPLILWSIDTEDWKTRDTASTVAAAIEAADGDIVLMHDVREDTAAAAEQIIPALLEKGFKLVTVSEMFEAKGITLEKGTTYRKAK